jgi:hypothetical protein
MLTRAHHHVTRRLQSREALLTGAARLWDIDAIISLALVYALLFSLWLRDAEREPRDLSR